jgi:hypothetical protein
MVQGVGADRSTTSTISGVATVHVSLATSSLVAGQTTQATATAADGSGQTVTGHSVNWSSNSPAASVSPSGVVTAVSLGPVTITGTVDGVTGSSVVDVTPQNNPFLATQLGMSAQPSASVEGGTVFPKQPAVQLLNFTAGAVSQAGVQVTVSIASGPGVLSGTTTATTNAAGIATFDGLTISGAVGARTLRFAATGLTAVTSASVTITAPTWTQLAVATQPSTTVQDAVRLHQQPAIQLRDALGNAVAHPGVVVTATMASGGGVLGGTPTATTDATGRATFTDLALIGPVGNHTLNFVANAVTTVGSGTIAVSLGLPAALAIARQPATVAQAGVTMTQQPVVQLTDAGGNSVSKAGVVVTAGIATGGGTLTGLVTATTNANGVATFTNLAIGGVIGNRTLSFASPSMVGTTSAIVKLNGGAAVQLAVATQPSISSVPSGVIFPRQPVIQVSDAFGNAFTQAGVVVTAVLATTTVSMPLLGLPLMGGLVATGLASGSGTLNGTRTAITNANGTATFTDLAITGADGGRALAFSAAGLTGARSGPVTITTEPVYKPGVSNLVIQDNMESYTTAANMGAVTLPAGPRLVPVPSPNQTSQPVSASQNQVIKPGRGGSGQALRLGQPGIAQQGAEWVTTQTPAVTNNLATHYFQYWARINAPNLGQNPLAIKWFQAWHRIAGATGGRVQFNTHDHLPCGLSLSQPTYWQLYDTGSNTLVCQGNQPVGPFFSTVNDNQWHRFTYSYRPQTSRGARDGFARMWIDGTLIIDVSASMNGVTPPGGEKPWCTTDDLDTIGANDGIDFLLFGGTQTTNTVPWTLDMDDLLWWWTP